MGGLVGSVLPGQSPWVCVVRDRSVRPREGKWGSVSLDHLAQVLGPACKVSVGSVSPWMGGLARSGSLGLGPTACIHDAC